MKMITALSAIALLLTVSTPGFGQSSYPGIRLAHEAKVALLQARSIALATVPGKIVSQELERERGGSGLRYTFDIKTGPKTREVGVDAKTGHVLEDVVEGKNRD